VIAKLGGGPNGAALGPDGKCYVCNNGGFKWIERDGRLYPSEQPDDYRGGSIQRVDLATGAYETVYEACAGRRLCGPNDIVFDRSGGFWFTDHGKSRPRERDRTGVFYARADGSRITEVIFPLEGPNGIGLSRSEDELYVAETVPGRLWAYPITAPGEVSRERRLLPGIGGYYLYDSLAVDANGNVCVATLINGGISILSPTGAAARFVSMPDPLTTNICFGGAGLKTAYITASSIGELLACDWECAGAPLNFLNTRK
ncbi:MAG TPA: SMP-30/gluconolactonase/LRE family protein, partial [Pseudomonadales bacterium]